MHGFEYDFVVEIFRFDLTNVPDGTNRYISAVGQIFLATIGKESGSLCHLESPSEVVVRFDVYTPYLNLTWTTDESYSVTVSTEGELMIDLKSV